MTNLSVLDHNFVTHTPFYIRAGQLITARAFFRELGWLEIDDPQIAHENIGHFVWVRPRHGGPIFCLCELTQEDAKFYNEKINITICFWYLQCVVGTIRQWAVEHGVDDGFTVTGEGPWRVNIPALFAFPIIIT